MNTDQRRLFSRQDLTTAIKRKAPALSELFLLSVFICFHLWFFSPSASAQQSEQNPVAGLAAGRVFLYVASDGIVIGALEQNSKAGARPPVILPLGAGRIAILLGPVEWASSSSSQAPVRLDRELPHLANEAAPGRRRQPTPAQASDIEAIGVALLERLRALAGQLYAKVALRRDQPLVELLLVDLTEDYGPEVWLVSYRVTQDALGNDYWRTRVLRPTYTHLYPPEKGQPRTLIEVRYPGDAPGPALLELLNQNDPRLARLRTADLPTTRAVERLTNGQSNKAAVDDAAVFLRAALPAIAGQDTKLVMAVLQERRGFAWLLEPPEPPQSAEEGKPREPGAPTLRKKP